MSPVAALLMSPKGNDDRTTINRLALRALSGSSFCQASFLWFSSFTQSEAATRRLRCNCPHARVARFGLAYLSMM